MNKLYPPHIDGTLPAFYLNYDVSNTVVRTTNITIPFSENESVSNSQIQGFAVLVRTISTGSYLFPVQYTYTYNLGDHTITLTLDPSLARLLNEGQYYKIQVAYLGKNDDGSTTPGYFSTVGIIKCISKPEVYIDNLIQSSVNFFSSQFIGVYDQSKCRDVSEKVYSYEFVIYDNNDDVFYTTGEKYHQAIYDVYEGTSIDKVLINDFISENTTYSIQYKITTMNGYVGYTPKYKLTNQNLVSPNKNIEIIPESNQDNGYVTIHFKGDINKKKSYYYIFENENFDSEIIDDVEYIEDANGCTAFFVVAKAVRNKSEKITYLKEHTLYRVYDSQYAAPGYIYVMADNEISSRTRYLAGNNDIRYLLTTEYENIIYNQNLTDEEKLEQVLALPYYKPISVGRELVKNFSYQYVEDNYGYVSKEGQDHYLEINNHKYYLIEKVPYESFYYGTYILSRASDADGYQTWYTIIQFKLDEQTPSSFSFRDMTVEHGRKYKYGLQQTNNWGLISSRITTKPYEVKFEDLFLYDGEKLLKIRFNPKIESFKTRVLEQKTDTLGGRFPFITRNGETYYKEFPIGGLIACEMDEDQMFHKRVQGIAHRHSTNAKQNKYDEDGNLIEETDMPENGMRDWRMFSDENILLEREFKLAVLDWLNNGQPKLFKSPYEGNYIIRLMNNELKPVEELGRMLHSFTSQAYEIAECNYDNLVFYGFLKVQEISKFVGMFRSYSLADQSLERDDKGNIIIKFEAGLESFTVQDLMPGDLIYLGTPNGEYGDYTPIMIGITGSYTYIAGPNNNISSIKIHPYSHIDQTSYRNTMGIIHCFYQGVRITAFDAIISQQLRTIPSQQYIGVNPWLEIIKRTNWGAQTNEGQDSFNLNEAQRKELQDYNIRDYLDDSITAVGEGNEISYKKNKNFVDYMYSFDPGEILDRINATLNKGEVYKIQLLDIEQARFRLRDVIPVYVVEINDEKERFFTAYKAYEEWLKDAIESTDFPDWVEDQARYVIENLNMQNFAGLEDYYEEIQIVLNNKEKIIKYYFSSNWVDNILGDVVPIKWTGNTKFYGQRSEISGALTTSNYTYVATSPYGYPHRIEELTEFEMIDPYCIFEVFEMDDNHQWFPVKRGCPYYDAYYRTWLTNYDPNVKINYTWKKVAWAGDGSTELANEMAEEILKKNFGRPYNIDKIYDYEIQIDTFDGNPDHYKHYYIDKANNKVYLDDHFNVFRKEDDTHYFAYGNDSGVFSNDIHKIYFVKEYDTDISLLTIKEKEYTELKNINSIHIGSGVIAELTFQIKVLDYYTEVRNDNVRAAKNEYLAARNFYNQLMKHYAAIKDADYYVTKYLALRNIYSKLLYGTSNASYLLKDDKNILRILLENVYEIEQLKLLKLYNIEEINNNLDQLALQMIIEYKNNHLNDDDNKFGITKLILLQSDIDEEVIYYTVTQDEINHPTITISGNFTSEDTIYRQTDDTGVIYYALNKDKIKTLYTNKNPSVLPVWNNLYFTYSEEGYSIRNINDVVQSKNDLQARGVLIEELTPVEITVTAIRKGLLNDEQAEKIKENETFISLEEIEYTPDLQTTFFELEELKNLSQENENYDVEGVANKVKDLSNEMENFNNQVNDLLDLIDSETNTYYSLYSDLKSFLENYNKQVYTNWAYYELRRLLTTEELYANEIRAFVAGSSGQVDDTLSENEQRITNYLTAAKNLYFNILENIPKIQLNQQMIDDWDNDNSLDNYLELQVIQKRGEIVLCIVAMYNAIKAAKELIYSQNQEIIYKSELIDCMDKYNEVYPNIADPFTYRLSESYYRGLTDTRYGYIKNIYNQYKELNISEIALSEQSPTYVNPNGLAQLSNYYEDLIYLRDWEVNNINSNKKETVNVDDYSIRNIITPYDNDITTIYNSNDYINEPLIRSIEDYIREFSSSSTPSNERLRNPLTYSLLSRQFARYSNYQGLQYNTAKKTSTYFYRSKLQEIKLSDIEIDANHFSTFIFYPLNKEALDSHLGSSYTNNYQYFNSLSNSEQLQVLQVSDILTGIIIDFLDNIKIPTMGDGPNLASEIYSRFLDEGKMYNTAILNETRYQITNPPTDSETGQIVENAYTIFNNKVLYAENQINVDLKKLKLTDSTRPFFKVDSSLAQSIMFEYEVPDNNEHYADINDIGEIYIDSSTGKQMILPGYYKEYLGLLGGDKLEELQVLSQQATELLQLYEEQYENYLSKYSEYNAIYNEYKTIYDSYSGTDEMAYYKGNNKTLDDYRQEVKEAWRKFLGLLDYEYTRERERGMYA